MEFPLGFSDLSLWLAFTAIILLVASELLSSYYGRTGMLLDRKRLGVITIIVAFLFLITVVYRIYTLMVLSKP